MLTHTANLSELLIRVRRGTYRPQASRLVEIPKGDGSKRPLAISCIEDKLVQMASKRVLESIYESHFHQSSYGYRPGRNAHDAIKSLTEAIGKVKWGALYEIDLKKYFNSIPHDKLMAILRMKISDERFLRLIELQLQTPLLTSSGIEETHCGVPQGAILSPILSIVYLHYAIDRWFENFTCAKQKTFQGLARLVRFCDDMIFVFEYRNDAQRFTGMLNDRLLRFGIEINREKSNLLRAGSYSMKELAANGKKLPTFRFLGFQLYWRQNRRGNYRLGYKPRADRFREKLKGIKVHLRKNRNCPNHVVVLKDVKRVVEGWVNYFSITDCGPTIHVFISEVRRIIHRWFNQRGGRQNISWQHVHPILQSIKFPRGPGKIRSMFPKPK